MGIDVKAMSNRQWGEVQAAFAEHGVIFFRDQTLRRNSRSPSPSASAPIDVNRFFQAAEGYPASPRSKEPEQKTNIGGGWHTDHSYDQAPAMGSVLLARELPPRRRRHAVRQHVRAYEALSPGLQATLAG